MVHKFNLAHAYMSSVLNAWRGRWIIIECSAGANHASLANGL